MTGCQSARIINTARNFLGVKESPPNSNNVIFNSLYYGRPVSGSEFPWCCVFVWYIFREAGLSSLFYGGGKTASCTTLMSFAKKHGRFRTSDYKPGDLALMNWNGGKDIAQHIGIITETHNGSIVTIEGNTSVGNDSDGGEVMMRSRPLSVIIGVYRPDYKEDEIVDIDSLRRDLTDISGTGADCSDWARDAAGELTSLGILKGDGSGNFGWGQLVTRETLAQVVCNLLNFIRNEE